MSKLLFWSCGHVHREFSIETGHSFGTRIWIRDEHGSEAHSETNRDQFEVERHILILLFAFGVS